MPDPRHALGNAAENAVATWLAGVGWRILARRWRAPTCGEVDLVALDPTGVLVAIEVRARRTSRTGTALGSVDEGRPPRLARSLIAFATSSGVHHAGLRIDVIGAEPVAGSPGMWRIRRTPGVG